MISLITVEGPTASGKTALAIALARELGLQIISADSRQVYKYMDIGTAKPSAPELNAVPHHLIGFLEPSECYNAGSFVKDSDAIIHQLLAEGIIPVVCGGTGMYVRALLDGLCILPQIDASIRARLLERLEVDGLATLYRELYSVDQEFAAKISSNDTQRILRGLEVYLGTGRSLSIHWKEQCKSPRYKGIRILIDPPREILYKRIDTRVEKMFSKGLEEEVKALADRGYVWTDPGMNTLGYREFRDYFSGTVNRDTLMKNIAQHTRNYAKRQCTWYRKCTFDLTFATRELNISMMLATIKASLNEAQENQ
jgi:tRNA dimethylallyltransferase